MKEFIANVSEMREWGKKFARKLKAPVTVALHGDLGMGKTEITRAVIQELRGRDTVVPSPTFTIVQTYDGISHFDLYRITDVSELEEIGLSYAIQNDITIIEWPEIAESFLPSDTIHVFITEKDGGREILLIDK